MYVRPSFFCCTWCAHIMSHKAFKQTVINGRSNFLVCCRCGGFSLASATSSQTLSSPTRIDAGNNQCHPNYTTENNNSSSGGSNDGICSSSINGGNHSSSSSCTSTGSGVNSSSKVSLHSAVPRQTTLMAITGHHHPRLWSPQTTSRSPCAAAYLTTSATAYHAESDDATSLTAKRKRKRAPAQQAYLDRYPLSSERWKQWISALTSVPHLAADEAQAILYSHPQLLRSAPDEVASRLCHMSQLLLREMDLSGAEYAHILQTFPLAIRVQVHQASAALVWFRHEFSFGMLDLRKIAKFAPELLLYRVEELQRRLQTLLDLELSIQDVRACVSKYPGLLTVNPATLLLKLHILCGEFGCSRLHILTHEAVTLKLSTERLRSRACFLRQLGITCVEIKHVRAKSNDTDFAGIAVRAYLTHTGVSLPQLCNEMQILPGMAAAMELAGLPPHITSPLQCLHAFVCLHTSQAATTVVSTKGLKLSSHKRMKTAVLNK